MSSERRDRLRLALVPGLGPVLTRRLVARLGGPAAALAVTREQLMEDDRIGPKTADKILAGLRRSADILAAEVAAIKEFDVGVAMLGEQRYPAMLAAIADAPDMLYYRGAIQQPFERSVAVVGSRRCTAYGLDHARRLARDLAKAGFGVVSGLALGIDGAAHQGALEAGGWTAGVLACGLSITYPPEHMELGRAVTEKGCLISEVPMRLEPTKGAFHARNRLIAALAKAVVVVEANDASGALITARHALDQGKEVFALPANVDNPASGGSLQLIRDGARLIRNADDLLDDLRDLGEAVPDRPAKPPRRPDLPKRVSRPTRVKKSAEPPPVPPLPFVPAPDASDPTMPRTEADMGLPPPIPAHLLPPPEFQDDAERQAWEALAEPAHADALIQKLGRPAQEVTGALLKLQVRGKVEHRPGNVWARK